ncbi:MAG: hypothetical protein Barrevirus18_5 [Barrevirus sp.]|uniref:Uncharacterized protein n=1 Tax=Barrevirus sp. TaxID=2487763 RepID=A0A3G4ZT59_9VIRU|nr:MAG: hypothetical protein Barrevirus18_5 [Barrevirus sp.]
MASIRRSRTDEEDFSDRPLVRTRICDYRDWPLELDLVVLEPDEEHVYLPLTDLDFQLDWPQLELPDLTSPEKRPSSVPVAHHDPLEMAELMCDLAELPPLWFMS